LSAGLGIGHLVEPLGRLRARADDAERQAKGDGEKQPRNALAIRLGVRSGAELTWRCRWDDPSGISTLRGFIEAYRHKDAPCPSRLGYDLRDIATRFHWVVEQNNVLPGIHAAELSRTLSRAHRRGGEGAILEDLKTRVLARAQGVGLAQLANELIIARWLSARTQTDIGALE
jgi:CRISPR-associated protein Cmr2